MSMNFNDAEPQADFSPLPDGTMVWLGLDLHFGGFGDDRSLTNSKEGDSRHLNMELTVLYGRYAKRKLFERWTVEAQNPTEGLAKSIAISRSRLRALLNSARAIPPKDDSERAKMGRTLDGYGQLHKMCFAAELGIRKGNDLYPQPRNFIKKIIEPDHELYGAIRTGTYVQPDPAQQAPAWGGQPQQPAWGGGQPQQPQQWAAPPQQQVTPYPDQQWSAPPPAPAQPQQQWAAPQQQQWNAPPPAAAQPQQQWNAPPPAPWGQDPNAGGGYVAPTAPTGPAPGGWNGAPQAPQGQPAAAGSDGTPDWATPADNDGKPAS